YHPRHGQEHAAERRTGGRSRRCRRLAARPGPWPRRGRQPLQARGGALEAHRHHTTRSGDSMKMHIARRWIAGLGLALAWVGAAQAIEVAGLKFDDTVKVAGKELKVNGAGVRVRIVVKVYAMVLYLADKK